MLIIAGVGEQGVILASELLGKAAIAEGFRLTGSEIIGMSLRGGSVFSTLRLGSDVYAALVPEGKGDFMIGLEMSETLRNITFMSRAGLVLVNTQRIVPVMVFLGKSSYGSNEEILEKLKKYVDRVITVDALRLALEETGTAISTNIVMVGASFATRLLPMK